MPNASKHSKSKFHTKRETPREGSSNKLKGFFPLFLNNIAFLLAVMGTYYALAPKFTVSMPFNTASAASPKLIFEIHNDSPLPIYSIKPTYFVREMIFKNGVSLSNVGFTNFSKTIPKLGSDESTSIILPIEESEPMPLSSAEIDVFLSYKPSFFPAAQTKVLRFSAKEYQPNFIVFLPKAASE